MLIASASGSRLPAQGVRVAVERELAHYRLSKGSDPAARSSLTEISSLIRLRDAAPDSSQRALAQGDEIVTFWRSLTSGRLSVVEAFLADGFCCVVAEERTIGAELHALTDRELILMHRTFQAETQKVLADGFDLSIAAISQLLGNALHKLGIQGRVGCTPLPVVLAALRTCCVVELPPAYTSTLSHRGRSWVVMALPALDPSLLPGLSSAERAVASLHVMGATYGQIASSRNTSKRTVANQIASLSKKIDVHGRFDLIRYWSKLQWGNAGTS